jgi:hypothetical protein
MSEKADVSSSPEEKYEILAKKISRWCETLRAKISSQDE